MKNISLPDPRRKIRRVRLYGDADLFLSIYNSEFWKLLFGRGESPWWFLIKNILQFKVEMFSSSIRFFLRIRPGRRTTGFAMTVITFLMMLAFNSNYLFPFAAPFIPFASPAIFHLFEPEEIRVLVFEEIRSNNLLIFSMAFLGVSFIQAVAMYFFNWNNSKDTAKRGDSILYLVIGNRMKISEPKIQAFIEPLLVGAVAYYFWKVHNDWTFTLFLSSSALCMLFQEMLDGALREIFR